MRAGQPKPRPGVPALDDMSPVNHHCSYAARRRKLACRPLVSGAAHGEHESLPFDGD